MLPPTLGALVIAAATAAAAAHASTLHPPLTALAEAHDAQLPPIENNDNRRPAGRLVDGVLTLDLRAGVGLWRPKATRVRLTVSMRLATGPRRFRSRRR